MKSFVFVVATTLFIVLTVVSSGMLEEALSFKNVNFFLKSNKVNNKNNFFAEVSDKYLSNIQSEEVQPGRICTCTKVNKSCGDAKTDGKKLNKKFKIKKKNQNTIKNHYSTEKGNFSL